MNRFGPTPNPTPAAELTISRAAEANFRTVQPDAALPKRAFAAEDRLEMTAATIADSNVTSGEHASL
jgi:hypothetical protein